jgi:hypothetical protein
MAGSPFAALERADAALSGYRVTPGQTVAGGDTTKWSAYFERDSLRLVREMLENPYNGRRTNEYLFEGGHLSVFAASGDLSLTGPPRERGPYHMRIAFDGEGRVLASEKFVNEHREPLEDFEPGAVLQRAAWLRATIHDASASH